MRAIIAKKRKSRWDTAPILDINGAPKTAVLTDHDFSRIFDPLLRYRYLPVDYLHAITGGSFEYLINRLNLLSRSPNLYVGRPQQQRANASANQRRLIYELAEKGWRAMQERGITGERKRATGNFAHELMTCQLLASFELGARERGVRLITWPEILNSESLPETTRQMPKPWQMPVSVIIDGAPYNTHIAADGQPFGMERATAGQRAFFFCPGIETDCGTEPIDASDFARSSIYKKFVLYLAVEAQRIYHSHFGFPNFYVPIITGSESRARSMMALLQRITGASGSKIFLFKTFPPFTSFEKPPPPSGHMLASDWRRVGYPPFNFLTS